MTEKKSPLAPVDFPLISLSRSTALGVVKTRMALDTAFTMAAEKIAQELKDVGGDPEAIGMRGDKFVRELIAKRKKEEKDG